MMQSLSAVANAATLGDSSERPSGRPHVAVARKRIYIAGPMRGYPDHNFPAFNAAEDRFLAAGWYVVSPVTIGQELFGNDPSVPGGQYLRADIREVIDCDAVALLPGWEQSTGARCEVVVAMTLGLVLYDALTGQSVGYPNRVICNGGYEQPAGAVDSLDAAFQDVISWQMATFPVRTPHSITKHLLKEAAELHAAPDDEEEWADVLMLALALSAPRHGASRRDPVAALRRKLAKNKTRVWGEPDADGVVEHLRVESSTPAAS